MVYILVKKETLAPERKDGVLYRTYRYTYKNSETQAEHIRIKKVKYNYQKKPDSEKQHHKAGRKKLPEAFKTARRKVYTHIKNLNTAQLIYLEKFITQMIEKTTREGKKTKKT